MLEDCKLNEQLPSLENNSNKMIEECSTIVSRNRQESLCQIIVTVFRASNYVLFSSQSKTPMSWLIVIRERTRRKSLDAKEDYIRDQSKRSGICLRYSSTRKLDQRSRSLMRLDVHVHCAPGEKRLRRRECTRDYPTRRGALRREKSFS